MFTLNIENIRNSCVFRSLICGCLAISVGCASNQSSYIDSVGGDGFRDIDAEYHYQGSRFHVSGKLRDAVLMDSGAPRLALTSEGDSLVLTDVSANTQYHWFTQQHTTQLKITDFQSQQPRSPQAAKFDRALQGLVRTFPVAVTSRLDNLLAAQQFVLGECEFRKLTNDGIRLRYLQTASTTHTLNKRQRSSLVTLLNNFDDNDYLRQAIMHVAQILPSEDRASWRQLIDITEILDSPSLMVELLLCFAAKSTTLDAVWNELVVTTTQLEDDYQKRKLMVGLSKIAKGKKLANIFNLSTAIQSDYEAKRLVCQLSKLPWDKSALNAALSFVETIQQIDEGNTALECIASQYPEVFALDAMATDAKRDEKI